MLAVFILFLLSFAGLVVLFFHKIYEVKKGRSMLALNIRARADAIINSAVFQQKDVIVAKGKHAFRTFLNDARHSSYQFFMKTLHGIHAWLTRFLERMKGLGNTRKNKGTVSFFLKNVSEHKEEMKKGLQGGKVDGEVGPSEM